MQNKLMKVNSYDDGDSFWRVACDCSDPNHDVSLWFEVEDKDFPYLNLNMSMEIGAHVPWYKRWATVRGFLWRINAASKILFTGYYKMSGDVVLDRDGIEAMKMALEQGLKHAEECEERYRKLTPKA